MRFYRVMFWTAEPLPWRALISSEEITPSSTDPQPELGEDC